MKWFIAEPPHDHSVLVEVYSGIAVFVSSDVWCDYSGSEKWTKILNIGDDVYEACPLLLT